MQYLSSLPPKMDEERLKEIVRCINQGTASTEEEDEVIFSHLRIAISIVRALSYRYGFRYYDDLEGEAIFVVTRAVREFALVEHDNITGYIVKTLKNRLKSEIERFRLTRMPARTIRRKLRDGINRGMGLHPEVTEAFLNGKLSEENMQILSKLLPKDQTLYLEEGRRLPKEEFDSFIRERIYKSLPIPKLMSIKDSEHDIALEEYFDYKVGGRGLPFAIPVTKPIISREFVDALKQSIESPIQDYIVQLRTEGYGYEEIGRKVGMSKSKVGNVINQIEERFNKLY